MRSFAWIAICVVILAVPCVVLAGGHNGFDGVVSSLESRYHAHATRVPFLGLASFVARKATDGGVADVHIAEFDHFSEQVDGDELNALVEQRLGPDWERMIRETSRSGREQTLIFSHPEGSRMGLFVLDLDGRELDVIQVSVDPDHLNQSIARYEHHREDIND
jgi:hypothetical protein